MSRIFEPYRSLGLCSSDVPFVVKYAKHSNVYYIAVPIGDMFNVYKLPRLTLVATSDPVESTIKAFAASGDLVYAAAGKVVYVYRSLRYLLHRLCGHTSSITHLLTLHNHILVSVDESSCMKIWDLKSSEIISEIDFSNKSFQITVILHPLEYKNKILIGSSQGPLQLWNIVSQKQLYWFKGFDSAVTCLQQAPAIDVCAVGLADGRIIIHNIKYDIRLLSFFSDGGAITAIDFRCGTNGFRNAFNVDEEYNLASLPTQNEDLFMVSGSESGLICCWQLLNDGKSRPVGPGHYMHWGRVMNIYCIPGGDAVGAMVTAGTDNCIKVSYFDRPDGGPRTEYRRAGHMAPPNEILFWPGCASGGSLILSAGQDSVLRIYSTFNEHMDKSLGRAYAPGVPDRRKASTEQRSAWLLPSVSHLAACATRAEAWDSVVAVHAGKRQVTTWNFINATRGRHWLDPSKFHGKGGESTRLYKHTYATCAYVTNCGNYVLIGYSNGDVFKFNMQSGLERGSYGDPSAHDRAIVGVFVNQVNRLTVTIAGVLVRFWSFYKHNSLDEIVLTTDENVTALFARFHLDSDMLAVAISTATLVLIDVAHRRVIRRFFNDEQQQCVEMAISSDGRWLISAHHGSHSLIKTWDIVDSKLIDCFRVGLPVTSIAISPASEFLATTHINSLGIYLWSNRAIYKRLHLHPLPNNYLPPNDEAAVNLPTRSMAPLRNDDGDEVGAHIRGCDSENEDQDPSIETEYLSPEQVQGDLVTTSGLPSSYFTSLLNWDLIRERNRQATLTDSASDDNNKRLPFFLPTVETGKGLIWKDDTNQTDENKKSQKRSRKRRSIFDDNTLNALEPVPGLSTKLIQAKDDDDYSKLIATLKSLGPSALDMEIRLLLPAADQELSPNSHDRLHSFLRLLINRFERNLDIDFSCACLEVILTQHGDLISTTQENASSLSFNQLLPEVVQCTSDTTFRLLQHAVEAKRKCQVSLADRVSRSICLVDFIRNPTTGLNF